MDVALPIDGGDNSYIIYIRDTGETGASLNTELFMIILEALIIGLIISVLLSFLLSKSMTAVSYTHLIPHFADCSNIVFCTYAS